MTTKQTTEAGERTQSGTIAREAIQSRDRETGQVGDYLFAGDSPASGRRVSPIFATLSELYTWTRDNGWQSEGGAYVFRP